MNAEFHKDVNDVTITHVQALQIETTIGIANECTYLLSSTIILPLIIRIARNFPILAEIPRIDLLVGAANIGPFTDRNINSVCNQPPVECVGLRVN